MDGLATKMICTVIASYIQVYQNTEFKATKAQWAGTRDASSQINAFHG